MNFRRMFAVFLIFWLVAPSLLLIKPKAADDNLPPELKEKALNLLKNVSKDTAQFGLPENRVRSQISTADVMWEYDEKDSRAIFKNAQVELQSIFAQLKGMDEEKPTDGTRNYYMMLYEAKNLRRELVLALATHDPEMALETLQALRAGEEDSEPEENKELNAALARAATQKDPQRAYELAKKSLADGYNYNVIETVKSLYKKDADIGAKFARDVLAKIKNREFKRNPTSNTANANVAANTVTIDGQAINIWELNPLLQLAVELNRKAQKNSTTDKKITPLFTETEMKELVEVLVQVMLASPYLSSYEVAPALAAIKQYAPNLLPQIKRRLPPEQVKDLEIQAGYFNRQDKTADEIVAEAEKTTGEQRDSLLAEAARKAIDAEDLEKAKEIFGKIKNKETYNYLNDEIENALPLQKAKKGDMQEVRQMMETLDTTEKKIETLTELAYTLAKKDDKETAGKLLEEARQYLPSRLKHQKHLTSALQIAQVYALVDPEQCFIALESSIGQMNEIIGAAILLDDFYENGAVDNDELLLNNMQRQALIHIPKTTELLKTLAEKDFQRTEALADRFTRPEIRWFLRMRLAQSLLDPKAAEKEAEEKKTAVYSDEH
jgi:hypothetical protein